MRIVNREEFLTLPEGTLYQHFEPDILTGLYIKDRSIADGDGRLIDYFTVNLINVSFTGVWGSSGYAQAFDEMRAGQTRHVQFALSRDGSFDEEQLYAVWEANDIKQLHTTLGELLPK